MNKKWIKFLTVPIISSIIPLVVSCSSTKKDNETQKTDLEKAIANKEIEFKLNPQLSISQTFFNQNKSNLKSMIKMFILKNDSNLDVEFSLLKLSDYNETSKTINCIFQIKDKSNNKTLNYSQEFIFNLSSDEEYIVNVNNSIARSLKLKKEYSNIRLIDLFKSSVSNEEFIEKYIDQEAALVNSIGISYQLSIPTQTLNMNNINDTYLRFSLKLINSTTNEEIVRKSSSITPFLNLNQNQKDTFTIFNTNDLIKSESIDFGSSHFLNESYLGQLIFIRDNSNIQEIEINYNFSNKSIIGELDFSKFSKIIFNNSFIGNEITNVIFDKNTTIFNLKANLFKSNNIKNIQLPNNVEGFDVSAFDTSVYIYGIENIDLTKRLIDSDNNLRLDKTIDIKELERTLSIVNRVKKTTGILKFNKVFLPNFDINKSFTNYSISANELVFAQQSNNEIFMDKFNINSWSIDSIHIPSYILSIKKSNLPQAKITRDISETIKSLISFKNLSITNKKILALQNMSLLDLCQNLDDYFYTFSSNSLEIEKITFSNDVLMSFSSLNWEFFNYSSFSHQIIFKDTVHQINIDFYRLLKNKYSRILVRENHLADITINGTLYLSKFYEKYNGENLNWYLVGLEQYISNIDTTNISIIKKNTFKDLIFSNTSIELGNNITTIEDYAFSSSAMKIIQTNFNPLSIGSYSFSNSQINGDLNYSNLQSIGSNAFEFCNINSATFINLPTLSVGVFQNSNITLVSIPKITEIPNNAFLSCKNLEFIDLAKINKIGISSFQSCSRLNNVDLSNVLEIGTNAFASCDSLTSNIILNPGVKILNSIFNYSWNIQSIQNFDLIKFTIFGNLFGNNYYWMNGTPLIQTNLSNEIIYEKVGFDPNNKILDLSKVIISSDWWLKKENLNYLSLFSKIIKNQSLVLEEIILPNESTISNDLLHIFNGITINKLSWNYIGSKDLKNFSKVFQAAIIKSLDKDFVVGSTEIPSDFLNLYYKDQFYMDELNLINITKIGSNAFNKVFIRKFLNTSSINIIGSNAFNNQCELVIPPDTQLEENSFGNDTANIINNSKYKISREKIFNSSHFLKIYNPLTKVLDFSSIKTTTPNDYNELNKYINIGKYLLNGDVKEIILPKVYRLSTNLFSDLGDVESVVFQVENQVISKNTFSKTIINNKPLQKDTRIVADFDNFWS